MSDTPKLHDINEDFIQDGSSVTRKATQVIPDAHIQDLRDQKWSTHGLSRMGDQHRVASIPVAVHELWLKRDGFDLFKEPHKKVIAKLKQENLDDFITTKKRI